MENSEASGADALMRSVRDEEEQAKVARQSAVNEDMLRQSVCLMSRKLAG